LDKEKVSIEPVNFGQALKLLNNGYRITRESWSEEWILLCTPPPFKYTLDSDRQEYDRCPYIYMKTADNMLVPWTATQIDILANDWVIA